MRFSLVCWSMVGILSLSLGACQSSDGGSGESAAGAGAAAENGSMGYATNVPILGKVSGDALAIEQHTLVVLDQEAFAQLKLEQAFADAGTTVDFAEHSVILLSLGQQPTGGFATEITDLQRKGDTVYVQATASRPQESDMVSQAVTYPFCVVAVPKLPADVTLRSDIASLP